MEEKLCLSGDIRINNSRKLRDMFIFIKIQLPLMQQIYCNQHISYETVNG